MSTAISRSLKICRVVVTLFLLAAITHANAATFFVDVGGSQLIFNPQTLTVDAGDSVIFVNKGGFHNVVADDNSFRCARGCDGDGQNGSGNASSSTWSARVTFNTGGKVGYFCEVHGMPGDGMFGTINVRGGAPAPTILGVPAANGFMLLFLTIIIAAAAVRWANRRSAVRVSDDQAPRNPR